MATIYSQPAFSEANGIHPYPHTQSFFPIENTFKNYELSSWTHQDDFVRLLRGSIEFQGQAYNVALIEKSNGEQTLSFSLPLYVFDKESESLIDNPLWNLIKTEKKIRLIKNRGLGVDEEIIYDFVVKKVSESRDNGISKQVECQSYSMYELGKIGFPIVFSEDTLLNEDPPAFPNINYWMDKVISNLLDGYVEGVNPSGWSYLIESGGGDYLIEGSDGKLYEKSNIAEYILIEGSWVPIIEDGIEKQRIIKIEKSNAFNIIQELAEKFQVWPEFKYTYNSIYKTTGRQIIFRSEVIIETPFSISYGINSNGIKRETESNEYITKMYVLAIDSEYDDDGVLSITKAPQNFMGENFLYNFDYALAEGLITQANYDNYINTVAPAIRDCNILYRKDSLNLINKQNSLAEVETEIDFLKYQIDAANEEIASLAKELKLYKDGIVSVHNSVVPIRRQTATPPAIPKFWIDVSAKKGVMEGSFVFKDYHGNNNWREFTPTITYEYSKTEPTSVIKVYFYMDPSPYNFLHIDFNYYPLYFTKKLYNNAKSKLAGLVRKKEGLEYKKYFLTEEILNLNINISSNLTEKEALINGFEKSVFQAIKEGNWVNSDYEIKTKTNSEFTKTIDFTETSFTGFFAKLNLNNIDFNSIHIWNSLNTYEYSRYVDWDLEYGTWEDEDYIIHKGICFVPVAGGAFFINALVEEGGDTRFQMGGDIFLDAFIEDVHINRYVEGNHLHLHYTKISNQAVVTGNLQLFGNLKKVERSFILDNINIFHPSIEIYPTITEYTTNEEDRTPLVVNVDFSYSVEDDYTLITLKPTQRAKHLDSYYLVKYDTNESVSYFYADAETVLVTASTPNVDYEISAIDLSSLNGYELFSFKSGQKILINDSEMHLDKVYGFVDEVNVNLDNPLQTTITIKNYKAKFEDLFQRIVAATEQVTMKSKLYDRAAQAIAPGQTINVDFLQNTLNTNAVRMSTGNQNSVQWDSTGVTLTDVTGNLSVPGQIKILGNGIFISNSLDEDTGERIWTKGITAEGVNASVINSGSLDTQKVTLWNSTQDRLVWNSEGLFAYGTTELGETDFDTFININSEGLIFQRNTGTEETPIITTELSLTWEGLQIGSISCVADINDLSYGIYINSSRGLVVDAIISEELTKNLLGIGTHDKMFVQTIADIDDNSKYLEIDSNGTMGIINFYSGEASPVLIVQAAPSSESGGYFQLKYNDTSVLEAFGSGLRMSTSEVEFIAKYPNLFTIKASDQNFIQFGSDSFRVCVTDLNGSNSEKLIIRNGYTRILLGGSNVYEVDMHTGYISSSIDSTSIVFPYNVGQLHAAPGYLLLECSQAGNLSFYPDEFSLSTNGATRFRALENNSEGSANDESTQVLDKNSIVRISVKSGDLSVYDALEKERFYIDANTSEFRGIFDPLGQIALGIDLTGSYYSTTIVGELETTVEKIYFEDINDRVIALKDESKIYIQDTQPTVTSPSLWIETDAGVVKSLWLVTEEA